MTGADSRRGDSSTIPSIATGCGDNVRLQARSSQENRLDRIADQPPAPPPTATRSATADNEYRPKRANAAHATNATAAANHQTTGERSTTAGRPQPAATAEATTTSGRSGSGSRRTQRRSRSAQAPAVAYASSRISEKNCCASPIPSMASEDGRKGKLKTRPHGEQEVRPVATSF